MIFGRTGFTKPTSHAAANVLDVMIMFRVLRRLVLVMLLGCVLAAVAGGIWLLRSGDWEYAAYELVFQNRFHRYDDLIQEVARRRGLDPMVVKAVVWRESRFHPDKVGLDGERGLMQITNAAAQEWAKSEKVANFVPTDLFDAKTNLESGTWLLARALRRYESHEEPLTFALAEYNAGRSRVVKWSGDRDSREFGQTGPALSGQELLAKIDYPRTRTYIETVQNRAQFYHQRGRL